MKLIVIFKTCIGFIAIIFGFVGLFLPIWPTTPFVLLAIGCFSSSPKSRAKLLQIRFFREYYEGYTAGHGLKRQTVLYSLVFLWGMLLLSGILIRRLPVIVILALVGVAVTIHILYLSRKRLPSHTLSDNTKAEENL